MLKAAHGFQLDLLYSWVPASKKASIEKKPGCSGLEFSNELQVLD
jgi:hypothetical protein